MHARSVDTLQPGMVLGKTVFTEHGHVLLAENTALTPHYIQALKRRGFITVFVQDGLSDDVRPTDIVSEQVRATTAAHVHKVFDIVNVMARKGMDGTRSRPTTVDEAVRRLGPRELELPPEGVRMLEALYHDIERIMEEILESNTVASLESLKSHSTYTFQHSVDVAIIGILLGKCIPLPHDQIRELALGCLLHDIGKMYIDQAIVEKPDALTPAEFEEIKKHPVMGFELVRRLPVFSILPAHVAYQHHERQDGGGYPRGLVGTNRIFRSMTERLNPKRMLLIAEIAAVADVYSALASDRPYRPALPLDRVGTMLNEMAVHHLNRDVVDLLLRTVPMFPVGYWVEVMSGPYRGWRGVVIEVGTGALNLPTVRLVLDARGEQVRVPVEIDLREDSDTRLVCIPPGQSPRGVPLAATA